MPHSRGYVENKVNWVWHPVAALAVLYQFSVHERFARRNLDLRK